MPDFKSLYFNLFNKVTDAVILLQSAQQEAEQQFIKENTPSITTFPDITEEKGE